MKPIVHPSVQATFDSLLSSMLQTTLFSGPSGIGLSTLARAVATSHGTVLTVQPQLLTKTSTVPQISIDAVRQLYEQTRTKTAKPSVILIDDADQMTLAAQNSFLKLLEEPNSSTYFILTAHRPEKLLPTVRSRAHSYHFPALSDEQTTAFIQSITDAEATKIRQLLFIANGLPAELHRLVADKAYFERAAKQMTAARDLIQLPPYETLVILTKQSLNRHEAIELIDKMIIILRLKPTPQSLVKTATLLKAHNRLSRGGNIRIHLAAAVV